MKRTILAILLIILSAATTRLPQVAESAGAPRPTNFIVIFCDDLGYGDRQLWQSDDPDAASRPDGR